MRAQLARLMKQHRSTGRIRGRRSAGPRPFTRRCTAADIRLLAAADTALDDLPLPLLDSGSSVSTIRSLSGGNSSVGRAQPCQGWGREFESRFPLQTPHRSTTACTCLHRLMVRAEWQSGHAAACKAVYAGSIPTSASISRFVYIPAAPVYPAGGPDVSPIHGRGSEETSGSALPGWRNWQTQRTRQGPPRGNAWVNRGQIRGTLNRSS